MPKPTASPLRHSFLLRCWQERWSGDAEDAETMQWRFSLREVAETPQEHGFSSPEQLIAFLLVRLNEEIATQ